MCVRLRLYRCRRYFSCIREFARAHFYLSFYGGIARGGKERVDDDCFLPFFFSVCGTLCSSSDNDNNSLSVSVVVVGCLSRTFVFQQQRFCGSVAKGSRRVVYFVAAFLFAAYVCVVCVCVSFVVYVNFYAIFLNFFVRSDFSFFWPIIWNHYNN